MSCKHLEIMYDILTFKRIERMKNLKRLSLANSRILNSSSMNQIMGGGDDDDEIIDGGELPEVVVTPTSSASGSYYATQDSIPTQDTITIGPKVVSDEPADGSDAL